ncbi:MAG: MoaD/ThiS family protein [Anaerolineales bacterium]|nr:MoaD/ThiS family protein [Anaerolineales bacterium]
MQLQIRLYGSLRDLLPPERSGRITMQLPDKITIPELKNVLNIERAVETAVNGIHVEDDFPLSNNDKIAFFAVMAGGCNSYT